MKRIRDPHLQLRIIREEALEYWWHECMRILKYSRVDLEV